MPKTCERQGPHSGRSWPQVNGLQDTIRITLTRTKQKWKLCYRVSRRMNPMTSASQAKERIYSQRTRFLLPQREATRLAKTDRSALGQQRVCFASVAAHVRGALGSAGPVQHQLPGWMQLSSQAAQHPLRHWRGLAVDSDEFVGSLLRPSTQTVINANPS